MDWLKLFALLIAVASIRTTTADGPKKKIRIHLPQKVKHIHHHKKIYITNHPASSNYSPTYIQGVKGAVALPSNHARPAVASIVPLNSVELYEEARSRQPGISQSPSKLVSLYHARGRYGPDHSEWDEQEYDLSPQSEPTDVYGPSTYAAGPSSAAPVPPTPIKKVRIVKVNDFPRKKVSRKVKSKRLNRNKPVAPVNPQPEDELPVTSFHEQFYSDLDEAGTIRKIKKPPRVEKIIDGDTEHIHTYSEEHIHKVVFDDDSKGGPDHIGSMSALKNGQTLVAIPAGSLSDLVVGSMGTPSHLEYAAYNPRDVTHDHVFHDHGEIPSGIDINKEGLKLPPKVSYNSHGFKVSGDTSKRYHKRIYGKKKKPLSDFSYYESMYTHPTYKSKGYPRPTSPTSHYDSSSETSVTHDFRPIPAFNFQDKRKSKTRNHVHYKSIYPKLQLQQASAPTPFSVSNTVVHEYDPKGQIGPTGFQISKYRDPLVDFKDSYSNDFDYDSFASNIQTSEDKNDSEQPHGKEKKSISSQNINFGGQDRQTFVDHLAASASSNSEVAVEASPMALGDYHQFAEGPGTQVTPTPYTIKETSPVHTYYTAMAVKALHGEQPDSSNNTESFVANNSSQNIHFFKIQSTDAIPEPEYTPETRGDEKRKERYKGKVKQRYNAVFKEIVANYNNSDQQPARVYTKRQHSDNRYFHSDDSSSVRANNPQYGDKIQ